MMLRYMDLPEQARSIERAVFRTIREKKVCGHVGVDVGCVGEWVGVYVSVNALALC